MIDYLLTAAKDANNDIHLWRRYINKLSTVYNYDLTSNDISKFNHSSIPNQHEKDILNHVYTHDKQELKNIRKISDKIDFVLLEDISI